MLPSETQINLFSVHAAVSTAYFFLMTIYVAVDTIVDCLLAKYMW